MVDRDAVCTEGPIDCLIIGGGPAGLMAATYLGRFRRQVILVDAGESRAKWIPMTHNCPGFPEGIAGVDLLKRLRTQAVRYGAELVADTIQDICRAGDIFHCQWDIADPGATVVAATGILDVLPEGADVALPTSGFRADLC